MKLQTYIDLKERVIDSGYENEIEWARTIEPINDGWNFFCEYAWVVLCSGMKEQIARQIWRRIKVALEKKIDISTVFNHTGKVKAIKYMYDNYSHVLELYQRNETIEEKLRFLQGLDFIGPITKYHLAKNLGEDICKPDRHLIRIANEYDTTPTEMCQKLSKQSGDKVAVVDTIIWRAANLGFV